MTARPRPSRPVAITPAVSALMILLARPDDTRDPFDLARRNGARGMSVVERLQLDASAERLASTLAMTSPEMVLTTTLSPRRTVTEGSTISLSPSR